MNQTSEDSVPEYFAAMRASAFHSFSSSIMASVVVNSVLDSNVSKTLCVCIQMFWYDATINSNDGTAVSLTPAMT